MSSNKSKVWLAVCAIIENEQNEWLVVKKKYGGLKNKWSLPAGFVDEGETVDQAVVREVKEETGLDIEILGVVGVRTGVLHNSISDNMVVFKCKPLSFNIKICEKELFDVQFINKDKLVKKNNISILLPVLIKEESNNILVEKEEIDPGESFGYTSYKIFY
ncbi:MAG: hydrolase [Bacillales bacterium]|jgi:8-oxo-dGTP pyrophosphatase MutT (NUDIX family)|nr:hydrolase [Bacillales bacterium]